MAIDQTTLTPAQQARIAMYKREYGSKLVNDFLKNHNYLPTKKILDSRKSEQRKANATPAQKRAQSTAKLANLSGNKAAIRFPRTSVAGRQGMASATPVTRDGEQFHLVRFRDGRTPWLVSAKSSQNPVTNPSFGGSSGGGWSRETASPTNANTAARNRGAGGKQNGVIFENSRWVNEDTPTWRLRPMTHAQNGKVTMYGLYNESGQLMYQSSSAREATMAAKGKAKVMNGAGG